MTTYEYDLSSGLTRVEELLRDAGHDHRKVHSGALGHLISAGGKRLRPRLALSSARAVSDEQTAHDRAVQAAAAVELLHVGTLHHDDVMDESTARRSEASVNSRWSNSAAILSGDVLIGRAMGMVSDIGPGETRVLAETLETVCAGQVQETHSLYDAERSEQDYLETIDCKTAALFAASCQLGAMAAGADAARAEKLSEFGRQLGIAFQMTDDLMDLTCSTATLGKPAGSDLREGVLTLAVIDALTRDSRIPSLLWQEDSVEQVCHQVIGSGAIERMRDRTTCYVSKAQDLLSAFPASKTHHLSRVVEQVSTLLRAE